MKHNNTGGFVMIITILLSILVGIIGFIGVNIVSKVNLYADLKTQDITLYEQAQNNTSVKLKYDEGVNKDGLGSDTTYCSGGIIMHNDAGVVCTGLVSQGTDGIDDMCDNDDHSPYFYDKNININNLMEASSYLYDDDADARLNNIGFLYPGEEKTVFYYDKTVKNNLLLSSVNNYFTVPGYTMNNMRLQFDLIGSGTGTITTYSINDKTGVNNVKSGVIGFNGTSILSENADFTVAKPFLVNIGSEDYIYAINIKNPTSNIIGYSIKFIADDNFPVYQVPIAYTPNYRSVTTYDFRGYGKLKQLELSK